MARVIVLDANGKPEKTKDGRDKFIYSVDGRQRVAKGEFMEVRQLQQIGDKKKHVLVAYRPTNEADKAKKVSDAKKKIAELAKEIAANESTVESKPEKATKTLETPVSTPSDDKPAEDTEKAVKDAEKPKTGRTRKPRTEK